MSQVAAIVLAAGEGTRMKSSLPKVLHPVGGKPMLDRVIDVLAKAQVDRAIVVTGFGGDQVREHIKGRAEAVIQKERLGTGHAVAQAEPKLKGFEGLVIVTCGDAPLWRVETLAGAIDAFRDSEAAGIVLTTDLDDPTAYGRIVRGPGGEVEKIVEEKDATDEERAIHEINSGTYCFRASKMFDALSAVDNNNKKGEYYFTDVIAILIGRGEKILAQKVADSSEALGVNSADDLAIAEREWQSRSAD